MGKLATQRKYQASDKGKATTARYLATEAGRAKRRALMREYNAKYRVTPKGRYARQRAHAKARGIEFLLSFEEWWGLWEPHWANRGKLPGEMCMCRHEDKGGYALGNVSIVDNLDNMRRLV